MKYLYATLRLVLRKVCNLFSLNNDTNEAHRSNLVNRMYLVASGAMRMMLS